MNGYNSFPCIQKYPCIPIPSAKKNSQKIETLQLPQDSVMSNPAYTQGFLQQHIGRYVKIEFLLGTNMFIDKEGTLKDVGISYVVIQEPQTDNLLMADIYSIKFVEIFY